MPHVPRPSEIARERAAARLAALATPPGALGRLGELGVALLSEIGPDAP